MAWDSRNKNDGGQRWFYLRPDEAIDAGHTFYWKRHFQNWNSRCADCHSTNLNRNYSVANNSYDSQLSGINVACEAYHGPGAKHVELAESNKITHQNNGLNYKSSLQLSWSFTKQQSIAKPQGGFHNTEFKRI